MSKKVTAVDVKATEGKVEVKADAKPVEAVTAPIKEADGKGKGLHCEYCKTDGHPVLVLRKVEGKALDVCDKCSYEIDALGNKLGLGKERLQKNGAKPVTTKKVKGVKAPKAPKAKKEPKVIEPPKLEGNKILAYGKEIHLTPQVAEARATLKDYTDLKYWDQKRFIMKIGAQGKLELLKEIRAIVAKAEAHIKVDLCDRWIRNATKPLAKVA